MTCNCVGRSVGFAVFAFYFGHRVLRMQRRENEASERKD